MSNNFYEQYYEAQKALLNAWDKLMKTSNTAVNPKFNPLDLYSEYLKTSKDVGNAFMKSFEDPQNIWEKTNESFKFYQTMYKLWSKLSDVSSNLDAKAAVQVYNEWLGEYQNYLKSSFLPYLPDQAKELTGKFLDTTASYSKAMESFWRPWNEHIGQLSDTFSEAMFSDPKAYLEFLDIWRKNYDMTFSKFMRAPAFGVEKDFWDLQKASMDRFVKYSIAVSEYMSSFFQIGQDATKKVLDDYVKMSADGTQPTTFEEFYKYWASNINSAYHKVLFSDDFSRLVGNMVEAMSEFKKTYDKLFELYLTNVPVPKKSEMDSLYKTVYDLKKELRALKAEVKKLSQGDKAVEPAASVKSK